ncbi:recombinase family protein [Streptosporangium canum]|uniref:recombinase family protein n=1 Tax=Streptosporangium canum TaxID=324952 RepID=UPI00367D478C
MSLIWDGVCCTSAGRIHRHRCLPCTLAAGTRIELLTTAEELRRADNGLELLTGPLQGLYDPSGHRAALFAFFAGIAESEREYIREKSLEGQASARERGRHGGRPKVFDDDMIAYARSLRARGVPVPEIARKLVIPTGKNKGRNPSLASVYRVLGEDGED